jgi:hypothetical protein
MDLDYVHDERVLYQAVYAFYHDYHVLSGRKQTLPDGTPDPAIEEAAQAVLTAKAVIVAVSGEANAMRVIGAAHEAAEEALDMEDISREKARWQDIAEVGYIRPGHE